MICDKLRNLPLSLSISLPLAVSFFWLIIFSTVLIYYNSIIEVSNGWYRQLLSITGSDVVTISLRNPKSSITQLTRLWKSYALRLPLFLVPTPITPSLRVSQTEKDHHRSSNPNICDLAVIQDTGTKQNNRQKLQRCIDNIDDVDEKTREKWRESFESFFLWR